MSFFVYIYIFISVYLIIYIHIFYLYKIYIIFICLQYIILVISLALYARIFYYICDSTFTAMCVCCVQVAQRLQKFVHLGFVSVHAVALRKDAKPEIEPDAGLAFHDVDVGCSSDSGIDHMLD